MKLQLLLRIDSVMGRTIKDKDKKKLRRLKPISLYPLSLEEALDAILHTPQDKRHKTQKGKKPKISKSTSRKP
jgi:hypothetical protein